jgi:RecA/RadA recombinase
MDDTENLKSRLLTKRTPEMDDSKVSQKELLSTGSTLLNLACSGRASGGFRKGKYYLIVGDSDSGKSFLSMTCFAEASINPNFADYNLVYDNTEDGMLADMEKFFGKEVKRRLKPPALDKHKEPMFSATVQEFYYNLTNWLGKGPCIYVLDSMDALSTEEELEHFEKRKKAHEEETQASGSFGMSKAKANSAGLRIARPMLKETGSILIIVSQTRDRIGFGFEKKTRSGGHAQKFYTTVELWTSIKAKLKTKYKNKTITIGTLSQVKVKKNRQTGRERIVEMPIYNSFGIDDIGSMIDYLLEWKHWTKTRGNINVGEWNLTLSRTELIKHVEEKEMIKDLRSIVAKVWNDVEAACEVERKARY